MRTIRVYLGDTAFIVLHAPLRTCPTNSDYFCLATQPVALLAIRQGFLIARLPYTYANILLNWVESYITMLDALLARTGKPIVVATYPRSGTHLTIDLLRKQFRECKSWKFLGETKRHLYLEIDPILMSNTHSAMDKAFALFCLSRAERPIIKTHGSIAWLESYEDWLSNLVESADIFYVVRDGRNVLASQHVFMQKPKHLMGEFLRQKKYNSDSCSQPKLWANHVSNWIDKRNVHLFKFEDIIRNPDKVLTRMGEILGLKPILAEPVLPKSIKTQGESIWSVLTSTQPESTNHIMAKGSQKPKKWKESWNHEDRKFFHEEAGDMLIRLGYETSDAWVYT